MLKLKSSITGAGIDLTFDLNVKKMKEMLFDFKKAPTVIPGLFIGGVKVQRVTEYKYLGTVLDNKLNLKTKQKTNKLRSLNVSAAVLLTFYLYQF